MNVTKKEMQVLQLLTQNPSGMYGLEMVRKSGGSIKRGSVYVLLERIIRKGLIGRTFEDPPEGAGGLRRPRYTLNATGKRVFRFHSALAGANVLVSPET